MDDTQAPLTQVDGALMRLPLGVRIRPFFRALLYVEGIVVVGILLSPLSRGLKGAPIPGWLQTSVVYAVGNLALLWLAAKMLRHIDGRSYRALGLWFYDGWRRECAVGIVVGGMLLGATALSIALGGGIRYTGVAGASAALAKSLAGSFILLTLAAAFEEIGVRGYAFQRLVDSMGALGAVGVSSAIFGLLHLSNPSHPGPLSTANTMLAGVLLAVAYLKTRGLWLPIALHWSWNFSQGPVFGSPISGHDFGNSLFRYTRGGPDWLTGGAYGFEASALLTVTCTAAILLLWFGPWLRATPAMLALSKSAEAA